MLMTMDGDMKCAQNLSHEVCGVMNLASSTKMRKSFANVGNKLDPLGS